MPSTTSTLVLSTTWGDLVVHLDGGKVVVCSLPHLNKTPSVSFAIQQQGRSGIVRYVRNVFLGRPAECPPLGTLNGTPFQQKVWRTLLDIPQGETRTYRQVAEMIGKPRACRAVANACGKNPVPLFVPCHRVIGSDGKLHGFSSGTAWKRLLLTMESKSAF